ncbi:MAG TPA: glutamate--cysteine ligase, partial [Gammaproteobacteria bacterium]|nr:glutamate--cysteine ligase [Gammaproteobacteria bacterium]
SPPLGAGERLEINYNQRNVAVRGREPGLRLCRCGEETALADRGRELCERLAPVAAHFDAGAATREYGAALELAAARFADPDRTPSARALAEIAAAPGGFLGWALERSQRLTAALRESPLAPERLAALREEAALSLAKQAALEAASSESFEDYLARYYAGGGVARASRAAAS